MIEAYPLQWPPSWPRTGYPQRARFDTSGAKARYAMQNELKLLGASNVVISSNAELRRDGLPYVGQRLQDCGVAVYFTLNNEQQCIPCDKWDTLDDNIQAVRKTVEALRGLERWGAKEMVNAAFRGFKALPASIIMGEHTSRAWWEVLEVSQNASPEVIKAAYKAQLHYKHPDKGGNDWDFQELQRAYKEAIS